LIDIKGASTTPVRGQLLLTTVSLHEIRVAEAVRGWFDPTTAILSRSTIIPPGSSETEVEQRTTAQMEESHIFAAAAALGLLGYEVTVEPSGVRVQAVGNGVPAAEILRSGDVVVGADGLPVKQAEDLVAAIKRHSVGDDIGLRIKRGNETVDVSTRTVGRPENPAEPIIGVEIETVPNIHLPVAIKIESKGIGGPSAGLMFALGIYDLLDPGDLTRGRIIAGTGEIGIEGNVGAVGGIRQKVEAARRVHADVFIVPTGELGQACDVSKEMPVVGVDNLKQAVEALRATRGTPARSCP
jgi:PDZ domain-containing protein